MGFFSDLFGGGDRPDTPAPTAQERSLAQRAAQDFNLKQRVFHPVNARLAQALRTTAPEARRAADASTFAARSQVSDAARGALVGAGTGAANPLAVMDVMRGGAMSEGAGRVTAGNEAAASDLQGLIKMSALGRGLDNQARVGMGQAAQRGASATVDRARNAWQRSQAVTDAVGFGIGAAGQALAGGI